METYLQYLIKLHGVMIVQAQGRLCFALHCLIRNCPYVNPDCFAWNRWAKCLSLLHALLRMNSVASIYVCKHLPSLKISGMTGQILFAEKKDSMSIAVATLPKVVGFWIGGSNLHRGVN